MHAHVFRSRFQVIFTIKQKENQNMQVNFLRKVTVKYIYFE